MEFPIAFTFFLNGLYNAMLLFIIASGLSLIFGVLGILNLAHGALYMLGAYLGYQMVQWLGNFWLALIITPLFTAGMGALVEVVLLRRVYGIEIPFQLLLTFGLILICDDAIKASWGTGFYSVSGPAILEETAKVFGVDYPLYNLFVILMGVVVSLGLWLFLYRSNLGKRVRAAAMDRDVAIGQGIDVPTIFTLVFAIGSAMAGLAGVLASPLRSLMLDMGAHIIVEAFAVVVIGGLGSIPGALLGALAIGELNAFGILWWPKFEMAFMYILMAAVLILRPRGLLGEEGG